jgi:hypothetical protein
MRRLHSVVITNDFHFPSSILAFFWLFFMVSGSSRSVAQNVVFSAIQTTVGSGLDEPYAVAADSSGNVYIADTYNNRVLKETLSSGSFVQTVIGSGLFRPRGVAVDTNGNVYIGDTGNNRVLIERLSAGVYTQGTVLTSGLNQPYGVAVDSNANVYIADFGNARVLKQTYSAGTYTQSVVASSTNGGLSLPTGVAVDASGNVYIADQHFVTVFMETLSAGLYYQSTIGSGFADPSGIAVDASGNVYVASLSVNAIVKETLSQSNYTPSVLADVSVGGGSVLDPNGVAVDGNGNVYIADTGNSLVKQIDSVEETASAGNLGSVNVGSSSTTPMTLVFTFNTGATVGSVSLLTQGVTGLDFANAGTGTCQPNTEYPEGTTCTVNIVFSPTKAGVEYGAAVLLDPAGAVLATGYVQGTGIGPQVQFLPGTQTTISGLATNRFSGGVGAGYIAIDGAGSIFTTDNANGLILKFSPSGAGYVQSTVVTGINQPGGIAIDGAGDLYVPAFAGANILKYTPTAGGYSESGIAGGFGGVSVIAVDAAGNVYFPYEESGFKIAKLSLSGGVYTQSNVTTSSTIDSNDAGTITANAIVVDGSGSVYVPYCYANSSNVAVCTGVLKETPSAGGYIETTIGTELTFPTGIALDGFGNVYISNSGGVLTTSSGSNTVVRESPASGGYVKSTVTVAGLSQTFPLGQLVVDRSGNLYVNNGNVSNTFKLDWSDAPSLTFATTPVGTTSSDSPQTLILQNAGSTALSFPVPSAGSNPAISTNFVLGNGSTCPEVSSSGSVGSLAAGSICTLQINFTPEAAGVIAGSLVLTDTNLNAASPNYAQQTISLNGTGQAEPPTITFSVPNQSYGTPPFTVAATSNSSGAITYSVVSGPATISGSTVTLTATGTVVLQASQAATTSYLAATQNVTFTVMAGVPAITFTVANQTYGASPFAVSASSNSTGAITYSVVSGPATISGSTVTLTGVGTVVLQASQAAAAYYTAGVQNATFTVAGTPPTITFAVANHTYGNAPFTVAATSNSSGTITYSVVSGPATISGATITLTGAGTVVLQASQAAVGNYAAGTQTATFTVAGAAPTITFAVANQTFGATPFAVAATSSSTGAFTYTVVSGPATISGSTVTLTGIGPVVLQASEAAAGNYSAGTQNATFTVAAAAPTITFTVANQTFGVAAFAVAATSNSTGAFTYSVVSGPATISGSTVTLTGIGAVVLQASEVAAGNYLAGTQNATFTVAAATPTITFTVANQTYGNAPFAVSATSNSPGVIAYSVVSGPATISGSTVTLTGAGTVVLQASQVAAGNYAAGTQNATFTVAAATPTITFTVANHTYGNAPFAVSATSNSSGAITYSVVSGPATISGSTVTLTGAGTVVLQASQAAAGNYAAATQNATFTVAAVAPTITFAVANQTFGATPFTVAATSNSSGSFTYSVVSGPATVSGSTVTLTGIGTVVLQASEVAAGNYLSGTQNATFTVAAGAPTITFTVANQTYGAAPFTVAATSNSTGAITYSVVSGPATISGSTVTLTAAGSVVLQASQAAAGNFLAGTQNASFTVAEESQTITFAAPASPVNYGVAPISLSASASSGLAVVFSVLSGPASVSGSTLTITGAGTVVVVADQSGNTTTYAAAAEVTHSITVNKISPTAGLTASPNPSLVQGTVTLTATVASSVGTPTGSVVFSDSGTTLGTANLTGGIATLTTSTLAAGSHSITAAYSGDSNFNSVSSTAVSQTVEDFTLTIGASGSSQSVQPGGTATYSLPMTPSGGATFPAAVSFSASGVPTGFTATFSPSSLTAGSAATNVALMIQVPTTAMLDNSSRPDRGLPLIALSLLILPFLGRIRRSRPWLSLLALLVMVMAGAGGLATLTGCGGGGSGSSGESSNQPQTYNIIVTATSGTLSHSTTVTLVVE